jgi:hypothetical protein
MADIGHEHLHHMAKRLHHTNQKLEAVQGKISDIAGKFLGTVETTAGAWLGGMIEGRTSGDTFMRVPYNLGIGAVLLALGHWPGLVKSQHLAEGADNLAKGFIGSYAAAVGFNFGKRWKENGLKHAFGGGFNPYALPDAKASGELNQAQMADIVARMQQAAASAHP